MKAKYDGCVYIVSYLYLRSNQNKITTTTTTTVKSAPLRCCEVRGRFSFDNETKFGNEDLWREKVTHFFQPHTSHNHKTKKAQTQGQGSPKCHEKEEIQLR